jgi:hypothetical protein
VGRRTRNYGKEIYWIYEERSQNAVILFLLAICLVTIDEAHKAAREQARFVQLLLKAMASRYSAKAVNAKVATLAGFDFFSGTLWSVGVDKVAGMHEVLRNVSGRDDRGKPRKQL